MNLIKILIVDDHPMMRDALKMSLASENDMEVIGEVSNGVEAIAFLEGTAPNVILMDLMMPEMGGLQAITKIFGKNQQAKILVLTSMEDEEQVVGAIQAGALGYFPKTAPRQYLLEAIRRVADGVPYMPVGITMKLIQGMRHIKTVPKNDLQITITARQREIMLLLTEGKTDEEIAAILNLQESTVRAHVYQIGQRLGTENRSQIVAYVHNNLKYKGPE